MLMRLLSDLFIKGFFKYTQQTKSQKNQSIVCPLTDVCMRTKQYWLSHYAEEVIYSRAVDLVVAFQIPSLTNDNQNKYF